MRRACVASFALVLVLLTCAASAQQLWRLGATYTTFIDSDTSDRIGGPWGVTAEYSFYDSLTQDEVITGDVTFAITYRRMDKDFRGINFTGNYTSIGLKWRGGPGARPCADGFYGGAGVALALFDIDPSLNVMQSSQHEAMFEWSLFGGLNFGSRFYIEVGYQKIPDIHGFDMGTVSGTLGLRF